MKMKTSKNILLVIFILALVISGCSGNRASPILPASDDSRDITESSRTLLGLWDAVVIPDNEGSAEIIFNPVRTSQVHLNVLGVLQDTPGCLTLEAPISLVGNVLEFTLRYHHPLDIPNFTVFDMRGIFIGHGSKSGFSESLVYADETDFQLVNADGHTRLWNPAEYSGSGYVDGHLGTPHATANYTATLNGYKYFATDLDPTQDVTTMDTSNRGAFMYGQSAARHMVLEFADYGFQFQYAVDINWWKPVEPVDVPDSFDVTRANCPEPYHLDVWVGPGITGDGGSADMQVDVYDWQADVEHVYVEAPALADSVITLSDPVDMGGFHRFSGTLANQKLPANDSADLLFYAEGTDPVTTGVFRDYRLFSLPLPRTPAGGVIITLQDDMAYKTIGVDYGYSGSGYDYSSGNPAPLDPTSATGPWDFTQIPDEGSSIRSALAKTDPEVAGFANNFSGYTQHFFKTQLSLGTTPEEVYQAGDHWEGGNVLRLWGFYYNGTALPDGVDPSIPLDPPLDFPYPLDISTHFNIDEEYIIVKVGPVVLLSFQVHYESWGIGEGPIFIPETPGVNGWGWNAQPGLLMRTIASLATGGTLGQGPMGTGLMYEWIADDGTLYGSLVAGNSPDGDPNFNEVTYEIIGSASAIALRSISE